MNLKMTRFVDLPNEVVGEILDHVHPDDLVNFSMMCKQIHSIATRSLRVHRALLRKYSNLHWKNDHFGNKHDRFARLEDLLRNPWVDSYVKSLQIESSTDEDDEDDESSTDEEYEPPYYDTTLLLDAVKQHSSFKGMERGDLIKLVLSRVYEANFVLFIMLLPNLEKIQVKSHLSVRFYMYVAMQKASISSISEPSPLSRLKTLEFDVEPDWLPEIYFASFAPILTLSSLESLKCSKISERSVSLRVPQSFNISKLEIGICEMSDKQFFEFLKYFKKLRQFVLRSGLRNLDPFWVYSALYAHSRHTLETLSCSGEAQITSPLHSAMGSFVGFEKLKTIDIDFYCLSITPYFDDRSMAGMFPGSIQQISLRNIQFCKGDYAFISGRLFNMRTSRHPNLQTIVLSGTHEINPDREVDTLMKIDELKKKCALVGGFFGLASMTKHLNGLDYDVVITLKASA